MSPIEHILLYLLFFVGLFIFSKEIKGKITAQKFWRMATFIILMFSIIEGCRYGRGQDYIGYKDRFEHIDLLEETQKGFVFIMLTLKSFGCNYVLAFIVYSLIFALGLMLFIRTNFSVQDSRWMFLFAILAMLLKFENMIRQFLAFPFLLLCITFYFRKEWWKSFFSMLIMLSIHTGLIFSIICAVGFSFVRKQLNCKYSLLSLFIAYYVVPKGMLADFASSMLGGFDLSFLGNENLNNYTQDADRWLGGDSYLENTEQTFFAELLQFFFECAAIYISYWALKIRKNDKILLFYNMMIIGFVTCRLCFGYEILYRLTEQMRFFWFVPVAYALGTSTKLYGIKRNYINVAKYVIVIYNFLLYARFIFLYPDAKFVWMV